MLFEAWPARPAASTRCARSTDSSWSSGSSRAPNTWAPCRWGRRPWSSPWSTTRAARTSGWPRSSAKRGPAWLPGGIASTGAPRGPSRRRGEGIEWELTREKEWKRIKKGLKMRHSRSDFDPFKHGLGTKFMAFGPTRHPEPFTTEYVSGRLSGQMGSDEVRVGPYAARQPLGLIAQERRHEAMQPMRHIIYSSINK